MEPHGRWQCDAALRWISGGGGLLGGRRQAYQQEGDPQRTLEARRLRLGLVPGWALWMSIFSDKVGAGHQQEVSGETRCPAPTALALLQWAAGVFTSAALPATGWWSCRCW